MDIAQWIAIGVALLVGSGAFWNARRANQTSTRALQFNTSHSWTVDGISADGATEGPVKYRFVSTGSRPATDVVFRFSFDPTNMFGGVVRRSIVQPGEPVEIELKLTWSQVFAVWAPSGVGVPDRMATIEWVDAFGMPQVRHLDIKAAPEVFG